jgi:hypothetical protein
MFVPFKMDRSSHFIIFHSIGYQLEKRYRLVKTPAIGLLLLPDTDPPLNDLLVR